MSWQTFDGAGRVLSSNSAVGDVMTYVQPNSATTRTTYFATGRGKAGLPRMVSTPDGAMQTFDYDEFGEQIEQKTYRTDPAPGTSPTSAQNLYEVIHTVYDDAGRPIESRSSQGAVASTQYDANGNVILSTRYDVTNLSRFADFNASGNQFVIPASAFAQSIRRDTATLFDAIDRAVAVRDAGGNVSLTQYNNAGLVSATYDPRAVGTTFSVASFAVKDANVVAFVSGASSGNSLPYQTQFTYDGAGRLTSTKIPDKDADPSNDNTESKSYYRDGKVKTSTDRAGNVTYYRYDNTSDSSFRTTFADQPIVSSTGITDASGSRSETRLDSFGGAVYSSDVRGGVTTAEYDSGERLIKQTSPAASSGATDVSQALVMTYVYDLAGNMIKSTDETASPLSPPLVTEDGYDALGRVTSSKTYPVSDPTNVRTTHTTYANGHVSSTKDAKGTAVGYDYQYDPVGAPGTLVLITSGPDLTGKHTSPIDLKRETYDALGELSESRENANGAKHLTADGRVTRYDYDAMGRVVKVAAPDETKEGRVSQKRVTRTKYDAVGNAIAELSPSANNWASAAGHSVDDAVANHIFTTTTEYDAENRVTKTTLADPDLPGAPNLMSPPVTSTVYGRDGHLLTEQTIDPVGNITTTASDGLGRPVSEKTTAFLDSNHTAASVTRSWSYDPSNHYVDAQDRDGRTIRSNLDNLGRKTVEAWYDPGDVAGSATPVAQISFGYDQMGRQLWANSGRDASTDYTYTYNAFGDVATYAESGKVDPYGTSTRPDQISASYKAVFHTYQTDANGNVTSDESKINGSVDNTLTYGYDPLGGVKWMHQDAADNRFDKAVSNAVDALGEVQESWRNDSGTYTPSTQTLAVSYDSRLATKTLRDAAGRPTAMGNDYDHALSQTYHYTADDRIDTWESRNVSSSDLTNSRDIADRRSLSYDGNGQLTAVTPLYADALNQPVNPRSTAKTYDYDANGNLKSNASTTAGKDNRIPQDDSYTYRYDGEGNMTYRQAKSGAADAVTASFTYDQRNRMTRMVTDKLDVAFAYDADDRRVAKRVRNLAAAASGSTSSAAPLQLIGDASTDADGNLHLTSSTVTPASGTKFGGVFTTEPQSITEDFHTSFTFKLDAPASSGDPTSSVSFVFLNGDANPATLTATSLPSQHVAIKFESNHVAIDVGGQINPLDQASLPDAFDNGQLWTAWVDYDAATDSLEVRASDTGERPAQPATKQQGDTLQHTLGNGQSQTGVIKETGGGDDGGGGGGGGSGDPPIDWDKYTQTTSYSHSGDDAPFVFGNDGKLSERYLYGDGQNDVQAVDDVARGTQRWFHKDIDGSIVRVTQANAVGDNSNPLLWIGYDPYGNPVGGAPEMGAKDETGTTVVDFFKGMDGARLKKTTSGAAWKTDPDASVSQVGWELMKGTITDKTSRARPVAGLVATATQNANGRAVVKTTQTDGRVQAILRDAEDPQYSKPAGTTEGFAIGLFGRGGQVTLWAERIPGGASDARQLRLADANGNTIPWKGNGGQAGANPVVKTGDRISLDLRGATARAIISTGNDVLATAALPTAGATASTPTTWGMTFKTAPGSAVPKGKTLDAFDDFRVFLPTTLPRYGYAGYEWDPETGLYYDHARYYDPTLGRFLQQDPAGEGTNPYEYADNDPIDNTDPTGMGTFAAMAGSIANGVGSAISNGLSWLAGGGISRTLASIQTTATARSASNAGGFHVSVNSDFTSQDLINLAGSTSLPELSYATGLDAPSLTGGYDSTSLMDVPPLELGGRGAPSAAYWKQLSLRAGADDWWLPNSAKMISDGTEAVAGFEEQMSANAANWVSNTTHNTWLARPGNAVAMSIGTLAGLHAEQTRMLGGMINLPGMVVSGEQSVENYESVGETTREAVAATVVHRTPLLNAPFLIQQAIWGTSTDGVTLGDPLSPIERWQDGLNGGGQAVLAVTPVVARWGQKHHIATNKSAHWTPIFQEIFDNAELGMNEAPNVVRVRGHVGPHPELYHGLVYDRLKAAVKGLKPLGPAYRQAVLNALEELKTELKTDGSLLNTLVRKRKV